jgi:glycosyltransferase involved in cell wall biosynthesis
MENAFSIVVPAYNEEATIERAVRETAAVFRNFGRPFEIIVVDDGSADATAEISERLASELDYLKLLRHEINRGKGEAVRTGVLNATGEYILFADADLATHPSEAAAFLSHLGKNKVVIGSRTVDGTEIGRSQPRHRVWYGKAFNFIVRKFVGLPHRDTQCGFKIFDAETGKRVFGEIAPGARWVFDVELLARARAAGCEIIEMPVRWNHGKVSRIRFWEVLKEMPRLWGLRKIVKQAERRAGDL